MRAVLENILMGFNRELTVPVVIMVSIQHQ